MEKQTRLELPDLKLTIEHVAFIGPLLSVNVFPETNFFARVLQ